MARRVGIVLQDPVHRIFILLVWDDVAFGCLNRGYPETMVERNGKRNLAVMDIWQRKDGAVIKLSKGKKHNLAISGSSAIGPKVFSFEDPLTDSEERGRSAFLNMIGTRNAKRHALVIIECRAQELQSQADRIVCWEQGRNAWEEETPSSPAHPFSLLQGAGGRSHPAFRSPDHPVAGCGCDPALFRTSAMGHGSLLSLRRRYGERPKQLVEEVAFQVTDRVIPDLNGSGSSPLLRLESILPIAFLPAAGRKLSRTEAGKAPVETSKQYSEFFEGGDGCRCARRPLF
jgi:energy-coupling factor transporter ATP-binding protein EcfA2